MNILIGTDNFYPNVNGSANFAYELAKGLVRNGHHISVIAPSRKFKHTLTKHEGMMIYGIRSVMIPKIIHPARLRIPLAINPLKIRKIIAEASPQVIHIQDHFMIGSQVASAGRKLGIPQIGTNHFLPENLIHYLYPPDFAKKPLSKLAWKQFINVYKHLDLITTPTKTATSLIKNLGLKNPVIAISCGVDLARFNPKNNGDYLKKRYKITNLKPVILFVGRLDKEKNIDLLIKAFSNVLKSIDVQLVIAGKGKERSNLLKLSQTLAVDKNVTFTGFVSEKDLPYLYRIADVFAIASIAELQSIATMEAMACGCAVVTTDVGAVSNYAIKNETALVVDPHDINNIAKSIVQLVKNKKEREIIAKNGFNYIKKFNWDKSTDELEATFKKYVS